MNPQVCVGLVFYYRHNKLPPAEWLKTSIFQFWRSEVLCRSLWSKISVGRLHSFLKAVEENLFPAPSGWWPNSVPVVAVPSFLPSCWLSAEGHCRIYTRLLHAFHDWRLPSSIFKGSNFGWGPSHVSNLCSSFKSVSTLTQPGPDLWF